MDWMNYLVPGVVAALAVVIVWLAIQLADKSHKEKQLSDRMAEVEKLLGAKLEESRDRSSAEAQKSREELAGNLRGMSDSVTRVMSDMARVQIGQMDALSQQMKDMVRAESDRLSEINRALDERM